MTSSATPTDAAPPVDGDRADGDDRADDDRDDAAAAADAPDDAPAAAWPRPLRPFIHLIVQAGIFLVLVAVDIIAHGFDPPDPGEVVLIALPALFFGHIAGYVLRDLRGGWERHLPRLVAALAVLIGWIFVGWHERFRMTPPTVFLCLGWLAVVESVLFLWRTGFVTAEELDDADVRWWRPRGEREELEREKRSLLKAIKEIEFDREMGKTTEQDAGQIVRMYRARAIDVIKAIDELDGANADGGSVREEIERELRARLEVAGKAAASAKKKAKKSKKEASS